MLARSGCSRLLVTQTLKQTSQLGEHLTSNTHDKKNASMKLQEARSFRLSQVHSIHSGENSHHSSSFVEADSENGAKHEEQSSVDCYSETMPKVAAEQNPTGVIPGKGPPPEPPVTCCMTGCPNCVWIAYAESLRDYYGAADGGKVALEALEQIENPSLKMFVKLEMGLL